MEISLSGGIPENCTGANVGRHKCWSRAAMRPDGYEYYEILIVYVDNIMIISHLGDHVAKQISDFYKIKEVS